MLRPYQSMETRQEITESYSLVCRFESPACGQAAARHRVWVAALLSLEGSKNVPGSPASANSGSMSLGAVVDPALLGNRGPQVSDRLETRMCGGSECRPTQAGRKTCSRPSDAGAATRKTDGMKRQGRRVGRGRVLVTGSMWLIDLVDLHC